MTTRIIRSNGTEEEVAPRGATFELEQLQEIVGGYIEMVSLDDELMFLNEEGKLQGLPVNVKATQLFRRIYGPTDVVVGDVLICGRDQVE